MATSKNEVISALEIVKISGILRRDSLKTNRVYQNVRQSFQIINYKLLVDCEMNIMGYDEHIFSVI